MDRSLSLKALLHPTQESIQYLHPIGNAIGLGIGNERTMNLCGTSVTAEPELLMKKSFDTGNANTRGSNSPAMTPKRVFHGDSLMDQTPASVLSASTPNSSNTPLLNPLSANLKATSSLVSKLETGYHLVSSGFTDRWSRELHMYRGKREMLFSFSTNAILVYQNT